MRSLALTTVLILSGLSLSLIAQESRPSIPDPEPWFGFGIEKSTSIRRGKTGETVTWKQLIKELSKVDAVFLGETHVDETTHRVESAIFDFLLDAREKKVVLSMEMFERDVQQILDNYLSGKISEKQFLRTSRPWGNYRTAYRSLIETAKSAKVPVVAANFPRAFRRIVAMNGKDWMTKLNEEQKKLVPREIFANEPGYWKRVDNAVRGHLQMMRAQAGDDQRLLSTQTLWDNSMGEACALALGANPGFSVLHVNGGFHTAYWSGTARQFKLRRPDASMLTVDIRTSANPQAADLKGSPTADFVIYAESWARDLNEGTWAVNTSKEVEYLLHVPRSALAGAKLPMLFWFTDDGLTAKDGLALWKERLGDEAVIAVFESPYPAVQFDMGAGGRWFWPNSFSEDIGAMNQVVDRAWAYISRYYPVDPNRLVVGGEGSGATVASTLAIRSNRMPAEIVAFHPKRYAKIKDFPLPLPEYQGKDPLKPKTLHLVLSDEDTKWWQTELEEYKSIGIKSQVHQPAADKWLQALGQENLLRAALKLNAKPAGENSKRQHIVLRSNNKRAAYWARLRALKAENAHVAIVKADEAVEGSELIATDIKAENFKKPFALPRCPGPFGGTTVVVLPQNIDEAEKNAWIEVLDSKPLNKVSRFHRLRLAFPEGEHGVYNVLNKLKSENRKNVLVIPAQFCADPSYMQMLSEQVGDLVDQMTVNWSPGLGGR